MELDRNRRGAFDTIFQNLGPSDSPYHLNTIATLFKNGSAAIIAGRDFAGRAHLIVPFEGENAGVDLGQLTEGLKLAPVVFPDGSKCLDFECLDPNADDIFSAICNSLCVEIDSAGESSLEQLFEKISNEVARWKALLAALSNREPSQSVINGLFGELVVLEAFASFDATKALNGWFGPDNSRHDFEFPSKAVEVKTTSNLANKLIEVHGAAQLSAAPGTKLQIVLIQIERATDGLSIATLIQSCLSNGVDRLLFQAKLARWLPKGISDLPSWASRDNFKVVEISGFNVNEKFPVPDISKFGTSVASRVSNFSCSLRLDGLENYVWDYDFFETSASEFLA